MKIRLKKEMLLVVTPESYVEQIALQAWSKKNDVSGGGLLIEAYAELPLERNTPIPAASSVCPSCGHMDGYHPEWCMADDTPLS